MAVTTFVRAWRPTDGETFVCVRCGNRLALADATVAQEISSIQCLCGRVYLCARLEQGGARCKTCGQPVRGPGPVHVTGWRDAVLHTTEDDGLPR